MLSLSVTRATENGSRVLKLFFPGLIIVPAPRVVMRLATLCAVLQRSLRIKALVYPDGTDDANCDLGDG
ncbi:MULTISPECIES: hypothetical protein [Pseudomonas syringae group]|uniref:Uncharacterized protein n=3 Tax=Pseudomonas syringae group TaxID=136849 RepID=A0A2K4WZH8_PSESX|nr:MULTISPECIES: hypothetical protein [Pseudomonas syringae group]KPX17517.1 Unknown protein sequence [Pseudomonas amygdali pv. dendropanacis]KWS51402.1 hypothetical protein AL056_12745 [Pseudomonas amygdali pv. morsprunorum]KWS69586.1 hypothetical protein AL054_17710 [Pseudomonas amygdali pv. morsprunorum]MBI6728409.1 hypothetical protein [Pseudomonas amygdali]MBI6813240.1 hypothetical protein [Pseudomonas amygdali]